MEARELPRIPAPDTARFTRDYLSPARPVVLTGLLDTDALREALARNRSDAAVTVARTRDQSVVVDPGRGIVHDTLPLRDFLDAVTRGVSRGYLTTRADDLPETIARTLTIPRYCEGAPWRVTKLWVASDETVSVLHSDLADNLHTLVSGTKTFTLISPSQRAKVYPHGLLSGLPNGARIDPEALDYQRFPRAHGLRMETARLAPGETLFIPRGWWHHVRTAGGSVSLNTWWAQGLRLPVVALADWFKRVRGLSR